MTEKEEENTQKLSLYAKQTEGNCYVRHPIPNPKWELNFLCNPYG